ncbi:hypothetical protein [Streptomyces sp. SAS_260]|uniref:hypothetical protein n=1 Tax=Streptomyces sp. SAS_260 TaxID=3412751 RepID=UPI00403D0CCA
MTQNYLVGVASWGDYRAALAQYRIDCGEPTFDTIEGRASALGLGVTLPPGTMSPLLRGDQPIRKQQWARIDGLLKVCTAFANRPQPTEEEINQWKEVFDRLHARPRPDPQAPEPDPIPDHRRKRWPWIAVGGAVAVVAGLVAYMVWPDTGSHPELRVNGACTSVGQVLQSTSSGFTSNGSYTTEVIEPDGQSYTRNDFNPHGTANSSGVLGWKWTCDQGDPLGQYRTRVTDDTTHKSTDWVTFQVNAA